MTVKVMQAAGSNSHYGRWIGGRTGINERVNASGFNRFIQRLRTTADALPDRRTGGNAICTMAGITLSAFSVFLLNAPQF